MGGRSVQNLMILVQEKIILSKLGIGYLFHPFVKTSTYSVLHFIPILFRDGHFFYLKKTLIKKKIYFPTLHLAVKFVYLIF